jgi:RNA ligase
MKYETIIPYIEKGLIRQEFHPENKNIVILNYTNECQFEQVWDEITMSCRGLILDTEKNKIIARPFFKFFNYQERIAKGEIIPNETPTITEKIDGSLIIHSKINGKDCLSTRGSFVSDQAIWAKNWWNKNIKEDIYINGYTHLFEVCYFSNRIVVNYNFEGLVYLGSIEIETGRTKFFNMPAPIRTAKKIGNTDLSKLLEMDIKNEEGFVIHFPISDLRLKIKFPQYVKLHKIMTGLSSIGIWEILKNGNGIKEIIKDAPDEMFVWINSVVSELNNKYSEIEIKCKKIVTQALHWQDRKSQALYITQFKNSGVCFKMLDNEVYSEIIWKLIRPSGSVLFKNEI